MNEKPHTVEIFTEVAPKYEFLNSLMTAGMDRKWRSTMLQMAESALGKKPYAVLDLATGTGDIARMMALRWPQATITGSDPTKAMLDVARAKAIAPKAYPSYRKITWIEGIAEKITAEKESLDILTIAFGFRNVEEKKRDKAVEEAFRVLRPGGVFVILELGLPKEAPWRKIYKTLLTYGMPTIAGLFSPKEPYKYLAQSIVDFPMPENIKRLLSKHGFLAFAPRSLSGGMCWLYIAKKPIPQE